MSCGFAINYELIGNLGRIFGEYGGAFGTRKVEKQYSYGSFLVNEDVYSHMIKFGYDYIWRVQTQSTTSFFFGLGIGGDLIFI